MAGSAIPHRGRVILWLLLGLALVGGGLVGTYYLFHQHSPEPDKPVTSGDPRLSYSGPFRNINPDVRYVGDAACSACHDDKCEQFHQHPMGRSVLTMKDWLSSAKVKPPQPFEKGQSRFTVETEGKRVWHKQEHLDRNGKVLATTRDPVDFVIGSGHRGHSFFTSKDGYLYQTPISWYTQKGLWDLSPGFDRGQLRPVPLECLFCHTGGAKLIDQTLHRYEEPLFTSPSITCERCHGPASLHVEERERTLKVRLPDYTIVNPKHLSPELREDVCHQCHLAGEVRIARRGRGIFDYRPGLPLPEFWSVYVATPDVPVKQRAVGQVEQLTESKCFIKSNGKLGCATCHDPHVALPAENKVAHYRRKCLECHETEHPCSLDRTVRLKKSKEDSCMGCHMKRLSETDIAHTSATNHRILRVPVEPRAVDQPGDMPLIRLEAFHKGRRGEEDADRDLGMALVRMAQQKQATSNPALPRARVLLERARKQVPGDPAMLEDLSTCLLLMKMPERALEVAEENLKLAPRHPQILLTTAQIHFQLGHFDRATAVLEKARLEEPWAGAISSLLVLSLVKKRDYRGAADACKAWLEFEPGNGDTWAVLAHCQSRLGKAQDAAEAQRNADRLGARKFVE